MSEAERFILENQAAILMILAVVCPDNELSKIAMGRVGLIEAQILVWRADNPK